MKAIKLLIGTLLVAGSSINYALSQPQIQWGMALGFVEGGQNQWAPTPVQMDVGENGDIVVGGRYFDEDIDMDPSSDETILPSVSLGGDGYFAKYDHEGNFIWANMIVGNPTIEKVLIDESGQVYVLCDYFLDMDLAPNDPGGMITFQGGSDFVVFSYDANGNYLWEQSFGNAGWDDAQDMELLPNGNLLIGGMIQDNTDLDPGSGTSPSNGASNTFDYFLLELDAAGNYVEGFEWGNTMGSSQELVAYELEIYSNGDILFMVVAEDNNVQFDPSGNNSPVAVSGAGQSAFLKLDENYNYLDHELLDVEINVRDMDITPMGKIYFTGRFSQVKDIESGPGQTLLTPASQGVFDSYIASYDETFSFIWAHQMNGANSDYPWFVSATSNEDALLIGTFVPGMIYPDPSDATYFLENTGPGTWNDIYFLRYDTLGNLSWSYSSEEDFNAYDPVMAVNSRDEIVLSYNYNGDTLDVDYDTSSYYLYTDPKGELFINKYFTCELIDTAVSASGITLTAANNGYNYQWVECDGQGNYIDIQGETNQVFTPTQNGTYACRYSYLGCEYYSNCHVVSTVGLEENSFSSVSVYPNPNSGEIWIKSNGISKNGSFKMMDVSGRILKQGIIHSNHFKLEAEVPNGIYFLHILKDGVEVHQSKLMVTK